MSISHILSRLALPVIALSLLTSSLQARFVNYSDLPKTLPFHEALEKLIKDPKDKDALAVVKTASDAGDKDAQFAYAFALQNAFGGLEAPKDKPGALIEEAKELYKKAADAGQPSAISNLGLLKLATGEDVKASVALIETAANAGNARARITMGEMYLEGVGVAKDPEMAVRWLQRAQEAEPNEATFLLSRIQEGANNPDAALDGFRKAAENQYLPAMIYLGNKLLNGQGVKADLEEARKWFSKAVEAGATSAKVNLGVISETEAVIEKSKGESADEAKVKESLKMALALYNEAAALKVPEAYNKIGFFYENGLGVDKDEAKAAEQYKLGADAGQPASLFRLAVMNEEGRGMKEKNEAEALNLFYTAARGGLAAAQLALGERYRAGKSGLQKDPVAAQAWFERAAQAGDVNAQLQLANMYERGESGPQNFKAASELYVEAAKKNSPVAMFQLADMMEKGRGMPKDYIKAYGFLLACTKMLPADDNLGKQAAEKLTNLKKDMTTDDHAKGDEFFKQLTGQSNTPSQTTVPKSKPKSKSK